MKYSLSLSPIIFLELAAISDDAGLERSVRGVGAGGLDGLNDVHALDDLAKDDVLAIEPAGDDGGDEELGINVNRIIAVTFVVGSVLAGAGGVLYATAYPQVDPVMGYIPGLKAFVAAVLGGIGSIPGAMAGGIILGIAETLTKGYLSSQYADAISYIILIVILLVKPAGLFGKKTTVKV